MLVDYSSLDLDDPLLEASCEIYAIDDYYKALEDQIEHAQQIQKSQMNNYLTQHKITPDDFAWHEATSKYDQLIDDLIPRFFRGPFLISLYALYESIVSEIATAISTLNPHMKSFSSFRKKKNLSFIESARVYYAEVLGNELCPDATIWEQLIILSKLRNAVAHANGRIESLSPPHVKKEIVQIVRDLPDVDAYSGYIAFGRNFVACITALVLNELQRLIETHRESCRSRKSV
ncbi:hypothetical protein K8R14_02000 [bacterium]|nr:hypothetical protein [bacterium]